MYEQWRQNTFPGRNWSMVGKSKQVNAATSHFYVMSKNHIQNENCGRIYLLNQL